MESNSKQDAGVEKRMDNMNKNLLHSIQSKTYMNCVKQRTAFHIMSKSGATYLMYSCDTDESETNFSVKERNI